MLCDWGRMIVDPAIISVNKSTTFLADFSTILGKDVLGLMVLCGVTLRVEANNVTNVTRLYYVCTS